MSKDDFETTAARHNAALEQAAKIAKRIAELDVLIERGEINIKTLPKIDTRRKFSERNLHAWGEERRLLAKGLLNEPLAEEEINAAFDSLGMTG